MSNLVPGEERKLHGWKEIAAHFGRTTRTVQRWEREFGLPVHRMGLSRGDVVYAIVSELDAWQKASESDRQRGDDGDAVERNATIRLPPEERERTLLSRRRPRLVLAAAATALAILALSRIPPGDASPAAPPTRAVVEAGRLRVFAADGRELWAHRFEHAVQEDLYASPPWSAPRPLEFADLDGDNVRELLAIGWFSDPKYSVPLYCFEADGRLRFSWVPARSVSFGGQEFPPPFRATSTLVTEHAGRSTLWAAAQHHLYFPSVVSRLDALGRAETEFWTNGSVTALAAAEFFGQRVILIGATHNQFKSASLTVIDADNAWGATPASDPDYVCGDCPAGSPLASFVFPLPDLAKDAGGGRNAGVLGILLNASGFTVGVRYPSSLNEALGEAHVPGAWYSFDQHLRPLRAEFSESYHAAHRRAEEVGLLKHEYREEEESRQLFPILSWNGKEYAPLSPQGKK